MRAEQLLEHAGGLVHRRRHEYGEPLDLFERVALRWSQVVGTKVTPAQVIVCLVDLKVARLAHDPRHLDSLRALPILRVPGTGREPDLNERQLHARRRVHKAMQALGGSSSPAGSCVWHVIGLQRSVCEWAMRQGWCGKPVRQEQAQGMLVAALGMLAAHVGYGEARQAS